ncbi:hypothetical protein GLOTRDRAFT_129187 [Gloeophyllum trabeum ATCC 11539]|uniref:Uncharacterized protein n=1 Tax=Gloeophyllum trabeum (strain ATCC 11539 / FP-39264 / Madison 617) TaxID=670483 RepID=S7Q7K6_GLOTA|nr:uncharacterized protein GLOTRDRAFT_129187 [Gloeophyllum trabeum ATCC 11539]EPQ55981.1 hypothetical protein GLOTRDRAFT_129187 [Gloeophyllum trabeum ATCC 11539]
MSKEEKDKFKQQILSLAEAYLDMYIPVTHQRGQWKLFLMEVLKQFPQELEKFKDAAPWFMLKKVSACILLCRKRTEHMSYLRAVVQV